MQNYTKIRNIGRGAFGACTLIRANDSGKQYVMKEITLRKLTHAERQIALKEADTLRKLHHPNIITYIESFLSKTGDTLHIVMEHAEGGDLSKKIAYARGMHFSEPQILDWIIQMALALQFCHNNKVLHRDVKGHNVFLNKEGICLLGDFGIAKTLANTLEQARTFVGTPYYLSPELIREKPYDHMSDVWSLGVLMYELMALRHPFDGYDMKALLQRILKGQYVPLPASYSSEIRGIADKMLQKEPKRRIPLKDLLDQPLLQKRMFEWLENGFMPQTDYLKELTGKRLLSPKVMEKYDGLCTPKALPPVVPTGAPLAPSGKNLNGTERPVDAVKNARAGEGPAVDKPSAQLSEASKQAALAPIKGINPNGGRQQYVLPKLPGYNNKAPPGKNGYNKQLPERNFFDPRAPLSSSKPFGDRPFPAQARGPPPRAKLPPLDVGLFPPVSNGVLGGNKNAIQQHRPPSSGQKLVPVKARPPLAQAGPRPAHFAPQNVYDRARAQGHWGNGVACALGFGGVTPRRRYFF